MVIVVVRYYALCMETIPGNGERRRLVVSGTHIHTWFFTSEISLLRIAASFFLNFSYDYYYRHPPSSTPAKSALCVRWAIGFRTKKANKPSFVFVFEGVVPCVLLAVGWSGMSGSAV